MHNDSIQYGMSTSWWSVSSTDSPAGITRNIPYVLRSFEALLHPLEKNPEKNRKKCLTLSGRCARLRHIKERQSHNNT